MKFRLLQCLPRFEEQYPLKNNTRFSRLFQSTRRRNNAQSMGDNGGQDHGDENHDGDREGNPYLIKSTHSHIRRPSSDTLQRICQTHNLQPILTQITTIILTIINLYITENTSTPIQVMHILIFTLLQSLTIISSITIPR